MAFKKCCWCSLKTGVFIYAVLDVFLCATTVIFSAFENPYAGNLLNADSIDNFRRMKMAYGIIHIMKGSILLYGVLKSHSKAVLAYLVIAAFLVGIETLSIVIVAFAEPAAALLLLFIPVSILLLMYVYSFYRELEDNNTEEKFDSSGKV